MVKLAKSSGQHQAHSVLVNFALSSGTQALGRVLRFFAASLIIRTVGGPAAWGEVTFALTVLTYLSFVLEMGVATLAQIQAPDDAKKDRLFFLALGSVRFVAAVPLTVMLWGLICWKAPVGSFSLLAYTGLILFRPWMLDWFFQRKGVNGLIPVIQLFRQAVFLLLLVTGVLQDLRSVVIADVLLELIAGAVAWWVGPAKRFGSPVPQGDEWGQVRNCYRQAVPLFLANLLLLVHQNVDIVVIRVMLGLEQVGVYDYSYRLVLFVVFAGGALGVPLRRQLAKLREQEDVQSVASLIQSSYRLLSLLSLGFAAFALWGAPFFFAWSGRGVLPAGAVAVTRILAIYLLISFISVPLGEWLLTNRAKRVYLGLSIVAGATNLFANVLLVPRIGIEGAALSKVVAELSILAYLLWHVPVELRATAGKFLVPALVMVASLTWMLMQGTHAFGLAAVLVPVLAAMLWKLGFTRKQSWSGLLQK